MSGARYLIAGSADAQSADSWVQTQQGRVRFLDLKIRIQLRVWDMKRRLAGKVLEGTGHAYGLADANVYQLTDYSWRGGLAGLFSGLALGRNAQVDPTRQAAAQAVERALQGQEYGTRPQPVVQPAGTAKRVSAGGRDEPPLSTAAHRPDIAVSGPITVYDGGEPLHLVVSEGEVHQGDFIIFRRGGQVIRKYIVLIIQGQDVGVKTLKDGRLNPTDRFAVECP